MRKLEENEYLFYGRKVSRYGREYNCVDMKCLSETFNHVQFDQIGNYMDEHRDELELVCGNQLDRDRVKVEIMQFFIIDNHGADILTCHNSGQLVYYISSLDTYVWCVDTDKSSWEMILTPITIPIGR